MHLKYRWGFPKLYSEIDWNSSKLEEEALLQYFSIPSSNHDWKIRQGILTIRILQITE